MRRSRAIWRRFSRRIGMWRKAPTRRRRDHDPARPDIVLLNGGVFDASLLRERLLDVISALVSRTDGGNWQPQLLRKRSARSGRRARSGLLRHWCGAGLGVRIAAGLARSYYIGAATAEGVPSAVCLVPAGVEEGQSIDLTQCRFNLLIRQPVEFPLYVSSTQLIARAGDVAPIDPEQMTLAAADPHRAAIGQENRGRRDDRRQSSCPADGDRHARSVVRRNRRTADLEAAIRRARRHAHRSGRPRKRGRIGRHRRSSDARRMPRD